MLCYINVAVTGGMWRDQLVEATFHFVGCFNSQQPEGGVYWSPMTLVRPQNLQIIT